MIKYLNNIYVRGFLIGLLAIPCTGGSIGSPEWWAFIVVMNLLVNCRGE